MLKRIIDIALASLGLVFLSPFLAATLFLVWRQDGASPFYLGARAARNGGSFKLVKIRSMIVNADKTGVESTGAHDNRITPLGAFIRRYKIDELTQLWNVLVGDMSLVGPRPNTLNGVAAYTPEERRLLTVRPGVTDLSSIVFSDEGDIIADFSEPDAAYDSLIRPWKSRLGLLYVEKGTPALDLKLMAITALAIFRKRQALDHVQTILKELGADPELIDVCRRDRPLEPALPPGVMA